MLEAEGRLQTWALSEVPIGWNGLAVDRKLVGMSNTVPAERLADHRLDYLNYEGPLSGDRGSVLRLESGSYCVGAIPALFNVRGQVLHGEIEIISASHGESHWELTYRPASTAVSIVSPST